MKSGTTIKGHAAGRGFVAIPKILTGIALPFTWTVSISFCSTRQHQQMDCTSR
jgi:hypothetical protein